MNTEAMINHGAMSLAFPMLLLVVTGCGSDHADGAEGVAGGDREDAAIACASLDTRNEHEVVFCNELGEPILARVDLPEAAPPAGGWPSVILLHGSGGLFGGGSDCTDELQGQYQSWSDLLTARGYAVLMPDSFYSRGFCEWHNREDALIELDEHERLVLRVFDAAAAANWACDDPRFDCSRIAVMGFSNGASITLMLLHEDLGDALDPRLHALDDVPALVGGVAYYPGCGLDGELANELDATDLDRFYYPSAPVWVPHAEDDHLAETCEELRDPQVDVISEQRGAGEDMFELELYPDAEHGFDGTDDDDEGADFDARKAAQARTLAKFDEWL
jgi:dienelactone hydrolase